MRVLISEKISEHKSKTPEGYLVCTDCILARTGKQSYFRDEIFGDGDDTEIEIDRKAEEVFSIKTLASFENKPVTIDHPDTNVTVDTYKDYSVGFARDIRKGKDNGQEVMLGTLVITDGEAIELIENGTYKELSCGYDCDIDDEEPYQQRNIRGNHIAICENGRAGNARIVDTNTVSLGDNSVGRIKQKRIILDKGVKENIMYLVVDGKKYKVKEVRDRKVGDFTNEFSFELIAEKNGHELQKMSHTNGNFLYIITGMGEFKYFESLDEASDYLDYVSSYADSKNKYTKDNGDYTIEYYFASNPYQEHYERGFYTKAEAKNWAENNLIEHYQTNDLKDVYINKGTFNGPLMVAKWSTGYWTKE